MDAAPDVLPQSLESLFRELVDGPAAEAAWMLNPGDAGLLRSLDRLSAVAASSPPAIGGASIAAHADHLRYGLSLLNRWSRGEANPWATADWASSWTRGTVDEAGWVALRQALASEAQAWAAALRRPRRYTVQELNGVISSIAHLAYHLGAIRQIDRSIRGPLAE